jgi:hypothetical protein
MGVGRLNPSCITVGEKYYDNHFLDAFALSWTTFSTVVSGYCDVVGHCMDKCGCLNNISISIHFAQSIFLGIRFGIPNTLGHQRT